MVASVNDPTNIALSGVLAAQTQLYAAADTIAHATDGTPIQPTAIGSSAVAPPLGGLQPNGAGGQVFQALQAPTTSLADGGTAATLKSTGGGGDLAVAAVEFGQASILYRANLATLRVAQRTDQTAIDLVT